MAASTAIRNTAAGWTTPLQWTDTAGGTVVEWFTPTLGAATLAGVVTANIRAAESNAAANGTVRLEIARVAGDGTSATVWGAGTANAELPTTEGVVTITVAGADLAITAGQRLRFRLFLDDYEAALATSYTATIYYNGATAGASGDTYVVVRVALTESAGITVETGVGALDLTGFAPTVSISDHQVIATDVGVLVLAGLAPTVTATTGTFVYPDTGQLTLTGFAPTVVGGVGANTQVDPLTGALVLTGYAPSVLERGFYRFDDAVLVEVGAGGAWRFEDNG